MKEVRLATTTSAHDSGLLPHLLPIFERKSGYKVKEISVGSGLAIELARKGKADVLLVHDPESENALMRDGIGINRKLVMHNDFILVGPSSDPANVRGLNSVTEAFKKIINSNNVFISRDDASGTDKREKDIWRKAQTNPQNKSNYQTTKSGMAESLAVASSKKGYILTDRATFFSQKHDLDLEVMVEGDELLLNIYHVIQVNPDIFPNVNSKGAEDFVNFMISQEVQDIIGSFMRDRLGRPVFIPDANKSEDEITKENWYQSLT